ncbi:MAG: hypothetical protein K0R88_1725 [Solirubrobacterales bacterium]|nr:hypothetical protein [Solirubrobacterales bacterium]
MLCIWLAIAFGAYLVSVLFWRDDLPRSTIGAVALVLCAATALAIFGVRGPKTLVGVVAAFGVVVAVGGGTVQLNALLDDGPPQEKAIVNCPPEPRGNTGFVAPTLGYALVHSEASLSSGVLLRYPPGCELRLRTIGALTCRIRCGFERRVTFATASSPPLTSEALPPSSDSTWPTAVRKTRRLRAFLRSLLRSTDAYRGRWRSRRGRPQHGDLAPDRPRCTNQ